MLIFPGPEDVLYYAGKTFTAEWYYTKNGDLPALAYYRNLRETEQNRLDHMIKYLADNPIGTRLPETMYRIEDHENKIYALKAGAERFFNFMTVHKKIVITNAYHKHSQKMTKQDMEKLEISVRYRADYLRRIKEGSYYEKEA